MATETVNYGTRTAFGDPATALHSLASGSAKPIGKVDNSSTKAVAWLVEIYFTAGSSVADPKNCEVYLITSGDDTTYTDGISPSDYSDDVKQDASTTDDVLRNARVISTIKVDLASALIKHQFVLDTGHPWKYWGLVVKNNTGATLASSGASAYYTPIKYDNA